MFMTKDMKWYSIDPGASKCYAIEWYGPRFVAAHIVCEPLLHAPLAVCEAMQVRAGGKYSDDLLAVSRMSGRVTAMCESVNYVVPVRWKGSVPKEIHQRTRILPNIPAADLMALRIAIRPSELHNLIDAYGIGLWALGAGVV